MSNGGYMSYELICSLSDKITAFGSVTGNFMLNDDQSCSVSREIPLIHIHGTDDRLVDYTDPRDYAMNTMDSVNYWAKHNQLSELEIQAIDDVVPSDKTYVEKFTFYRNNSDTKVVHFKVYNGGHQWFGSPVGDWFWIKLGLGNNNHEINASKELVDFFLQYKLSDFN
jgi:poly(3-hydroxybutyrate) depolymerase